MSPVDFGKIAYDRYRRPVTAPILRPYQTRLVDSVFAGWDAGLARVAVSMATGGGKSVCFGEIARRHLTHHHAAGPVVLLAHRKELVEQAAQHFRAAAPELRVEEVIGSPGPERSTRRHKALIEWRRADALVTTVQTLASMNTRAVFPDPSLIICDESHHSMAQSWRTVLTALGAWSGVRCLGVTATPFREDHRSFEDVWEAIVSSIDIGWLIAHGDDGHGGEQACAPGQGYLVPPELRHLLVDGLDLSSVPTSLMSGAVDFREAELAAEMERVGAFDMVAQAVATELRDRKGIVFAPTVASSRYLAAQLTAAGAPCHHLDGETPKAQRRDILDDFRAGRVRWLSNVNIVSEGFDVPDADAVVLARPTRSRIFFRQSVGRALRPNPATGKVDAIVLDVAGASDGHSLAGVEALTDREVLTAASGESLVELLSRSDRERQGRRDRIAAHAGAATDLQNRAERSYEQMRLTAEGMSDALPGLVAFVERAAPVHERVLDHTTTCVDRFTGLDTGASLDELHDVERWCAEEVAAASMQLSTLEALKTGMRGALSALAEEPDGEVARAMVSGYVGTVRGELFGEQDEHIVPGAPGEVGRLVLRGGGQDGRPVHPQRVGWVLRSTDGHFFVPIQIAPPGQGAVSANEASRFPDGLVVGVSLPDGRWLPVIWSSEDQSVNEVTVSPLRAEADAYRTVIDHAMNVTAAPTLINPGSSWRRKPSLPGNGARAMARRVAPSFDVPNDATAGMVSDVISVGKFDATVDKLARWVIEQTEAVTISQNGP